VLAAEQRLRDSNAFRRTVRSGRRAGSSALVVHLGGGALAPAERGPRVGLVVSKAVGNAVVRNRVKRRLRHVVKPFLAQLPASSELVVRALPLAAGMTSAELRAELGRCLDRVGRGAQVAGTGPRPSSEPGPSRTASVMRAES
jgi:ribonuclease P protein component